jgi:hypothetical protein
MVPPVAIALRVFLLLVLLAGWVVRLVWAIIVSFKKG